MKDLREREAEVDAAYLHFAEEDYYTFVRGLMIPSSSGIKLFDDIMAPFQRECFIEWADSLDAIRQNIKPLKRRFWIERTKGAGKDSDLATAMLWLLAFPRRPLQLQVGATDKEQAAIIRRRMESVLFHNPWMKELVEIQRYRAVNLPSQYVDMEIVAADVPGSQGDAPDVMIVNELSHVRKWEFIENLMDNADKVENGVVFIATNAGIKGGKADVLRKTVESNPGRWSMKLWQEPAPWIDKANVEDAKQRDLPSRYRRLWWGVWSSGKGDALNDVKIEICLSKHKGPILKPEEGWQYIGALDLGVTHDHSGFVIVGINMMARRIRLAWMRGWAPSGDSHEVNLMEVENMVLAQSRMFNCSWVGYDPTEARLMGQRLRARGVPMREYSFSSSVNCTQMASCMIQSIESGILECYDDDEGRLRRDFGKFNIVERPPSGYKLESVSDEYGHADVGTALAIALPKAISMLARTGLQDTDDVADNSQSDLTKDELEGMPKELRDIYDSCDGRDE